jgi:hypothetical protein
LVYTELLKYAGYLLGLEHWHVGGDDVLFGREHVLEGIRKSMGRDVEVTFGLKE